MEYVLNLPSKKTEPKGVLPLTVNLLGSPFAILPDGAIVNFQVDNTLLLMAYLGTDPKKICHRPDLAALFYPDHDDQRAGQNIRQVIHRLRKLLKDDTREVPGLLVDTATIRVNPDGPLVTDVHQFDMLAQAAFQFVNQHDHRRPEICRVCAARLASLVKHYTGAFLGVFNPRTNGPLDDWVPQVRQETQNTYLKVLNFLANYHFERREYDQSKTYLDKIFLLDPLDENSLRINMKILQASGQRNQALLRFHDVQRKLQQILDIEPEEETILLAEEIRSGCVISPGMMPRKQTCLLKTQQDVNSDFLPDLSLPFLGRQEQVNEVLELLDSRDNRMIVIKGMLGSGKTRLALHAAGLDQCAWADGIYMVFLNREISRPASLTAALVQAIGIRSNVSAENRKNLVNFLRDRESLILIDNLDEMSDQVEVVQYLTLMCPKIKFIITTRKHLGIRGEKIIYFNGLPFPSQDAEQVNFSGSDIPEYVNQYGALQLFRVVARRVRPDFEINASNIIHIEKICELLGGLPLAIEVVASYTRIFNCEEIHNELQDCLNGASGHYNFISDGHSHHKKRFAFVWESLSLPERELAKTVFAHPSGVAAADLLDSQAATIQTLAALQDKSTLVKLPDGRVKLHPLVRLYMSQ